jgi:hypothetical protein
MKNEKNAHKFKGIEASLGEQKKLHIIVSMCLWALGKDSKRTWPWRRKTENKEWTLLALI